LASFYYFSRQKHMDSIAISRKLVLAVSIVLSTVLGESIEEANLVRRSAS
jgi:hypothetical protein